MFSKIIASPQDRQRAGIRPGLKEFAVVGLGRFGSSVAQTLYERGFHVMGIDRDPAIVQRLADHCTQTVALDATDEDALRAVDIMAFDTVVVAIGGDFENNLMTTVALHGMGVRRIICKALNEKQKAILLRVGAVKVVLPESEAGNRLALELTAPGMLDQIPLGDHHSIVELQVPDSLMGKTLQDADLRRRFGVNVVAIKHHDTVTVSPTAEYMLDKADLVVVIGSNNNLARLAELE